MSPRQKRSDLANTLDRALGFYRSGRVRKAVRLLEDIATSPHASREQELEALFWLSSSLHGLGEFERAIGLLEPICFDDALVRSERSILYRMTTRLALLLIDYGARPFAETRCAVERAERIAIGFEGRRHSRLLLTRGYLLEAQGQRARALRHFERAHASRDADASPFADTRYLRSLVPALVRAGRLDEARDHLRNWERSPDPFAAPHLQSCYAEYYRACGEPEKALRWAQSSVARAAGIEDVPGDILARCAVCRTAPLAGRIEATRTGLRALAGLRRRAGADQRLEIDLASSDANLALACLYGGLPVCDPVYERSYDASGAEARERRAAERALHRAERACRRAARGAAAADAAFHASFRVRDVRRRARHLEQVRRALLQPSLPLRIEGVSEPQPTPLLPTAPERDGLPVSLSCDAHGTYLVAPTLGLRELVTHVSRNPRFLVFHPAERHVPMSIDLWVRSRLEASAELCFDEDAQGPRVVLHVDAMDPPEWLERLAVDVAQHVGHEALQRGEALLERGDHGAASEHYAAALALDPTCESSAERLAYCLLRLGRADDAAEQVTRALEIDSTVSAPWKTLAEIFEATDHISDALHAYDQAVARLDEGSPDRRTLEAHRNALARGAA
jgi:tetratricopeptide (TPR) repeat protein